MYAKIGMLVLLAAAPAAVDAQTSHTLARPDATLAEPFSVVRSVRELGDGRVLVADWLEQRILLGDFRTGEVSDRGRNGSGPTEFRLPSALIPFRADSTLLVDAFNARVAVLDENGVIRRFLQPSHPAARSPFGADARGRVYFTIAPWERTAPTGPPPGDSIELAVWDPATDAVRTLTKVHGWTPSHQKPGEGPRIPYVVFAPQDAWTVAADGRVAIVRDDGYHLEWVGGGRGPRLEGQPVPVTPADRRDAARAFAATAATGGRGGPDAGPTGLSAAPAGTRTERAIAELERASTFAATLPAFRRALPAAAGHIWVERGSRSGQPVPYDVLSEAGVRIATVQVPAGQRVAAVGRAHAYVIRTDADDLQYLERHPLPALLQAH